MTILQTPMTMQTKQIEYWVWGLQGLTWVHDRLGFGAWAEDFVGFGAAVIVVALRVAETFHQLIPHRTLDDSRAKGPELLTPVA